MMPSSAQLGMWRQPMRALLPGSVASLMCCTDRSTKRALPNSAQLGMWRQPARALFPGSVASLYTHTHTQNTHTQNTPVGHVDPRSGLGHADPRAKLLCLCRCSVPACMASLDAGLRSRDETHGRDMHKSAGSFGSGDCVSGEL
jgi:hypothetical protein